MNFGNTGRLGLTKDEHRSSRLGSEHGQFLVYCGERFSELNAGFGVAARSGGQLAGFLSPVADSVEFVK
jgi:hypothetical protein